MTAKTIPRITRPKPTVPHLHIPEVEQTEFSRLESLIDDYLFWESSYHPPIGHQGTAAGLRDAPSGFRQWTSEYETVGELLERSEMEVVGECWERLSRLYDQALRLDHMNRRSQAEVWRNPRTGGMSAERLREITVEAKRTLRADLRRCGLET